MIAVMTGWISKAFRAVFFFSVHSAVGHNQGIFVCVCVHARVYFPNCLQIYILYVCDHFGVVPWGVIFHDEGTYFILGYEIAHLIEA